jgi:hypothetical protein
MDAFADCSSVQEFLDKLNDHYGDEVQHRQCYNDEVLEVLRSNANEFAENEVQALIFASEAMARDILCVERRIVCIKQNAHKTFGHLLPTTPRSIDDINAKYYHVPLDSQWRDMANDFAKQFENYVREWDLIVNQQHEIRTVI